MEDMRKWLVPGTRVFLSAPLEEGRFVELKCEVQSCKEQDVRIKPVITPTAPLESLFKPDVTISLSYVTRGEFTSFTGKIDRISDGRLFATISQRHPPCDRRGSERFDADICYAYRSLGILDQAQTERCWKTEQQRIHNDGDFSLVEIDDSYSVLKWRGRGEMVSLPVNISTSGMAFYSSEELPVGSQLFLYLFLPFTVRRPVPIIATIVRSMKTTLAPYMGKYEDLVRSLGGKEAAQCAVAFNKIAEDDQAVLLSYLRLAGKKGRR